MAARDERIFENLASSRAAGGFVRILGNLGVIYLQVRREIELRSLEEGYIPRSGERHDERGRLVSLQLILGKPRGNLEAAHSSAEISRST